MAGFSIYTMPLLDAILSSTGTAVLGTITAAGRRLSASVATAAGTIGLFAIVTVVVVEVIVAGAKYRIPSSIATRFDILPSSSYSHHIS